MKYLLLIYSSENCWTEPEVEKCMAESMAICDELIAQGKFITASPLHSVDMATSVRVRGGKRQITDGPFAETVEQLGGFYLLDVADLDEAIAIAGKLPPARKGTVEIRPLRPTPGEMTDSYCRFLLIEAPQEAVYRALTMEAAVQAWCTPTCSVDAHEGGEVNFRFGDCAKSMVIEKLQQPTLVQWRVTKAHINLPETAANPAEWEGTTIKFALSPSGEGNTVLRFEHVGLTSELLCHVACSKGWHHYLDSFKQFCETGVGSPFTEEAAPIHS